MGERLLRFTFEVSEDLDKIMEEAILVTGRSTKKELLQDMMAYYLNAVEVVREGGHIHVHITNGEQNEVQPLTSPELEHARKNHHISSDNKED
ncbi:MAG: hypothetical protein A2469_02690 [Candidatus Magasanikbacteria bacterium RIFOXYC2_FULL_40_16]|uniref:Uncharacterized protein n=3 Tax=Candidatus Magasanikiibacteriota TaxID=1752731 RepID=A0A1F6NJX0_9BACT|nr:MAG: hypothetical protein A2224_00840 [Candidatus Magasanikbacteria bacterium RIFOXYA2_FULL_40_20]OGH84148.1 MAG: hypothetical protein A2373_02840 [Candidatus Magasanikbacteria bacterium RIFOXYB1_FULL_40_15]OGH86780.1 MAG: hypothetical protein A2301_01775 [Candidatus Magasanikbacteria bacterium RIFOXYB2_FULL_40_13]OGH87221.1 MAG: hypothetical protein A2206_01120 [Candidatus Magasanikbacteria bacterium RIFOXYA1_FULL_40_8]OGH89184.1 MAG: hypothetical protein A2469_02690 [Candidatus Magasanikba